MAAMWHASYVAAAAAAAAAASLGSMLEAIAAAALSLSRYLSFCVSAVHLTLK